MIEPFLRVLPSLEHPLIQRLPNAGKLQRIIQETGPAMVVVSPAHPWLRQFIVTASGESLENDAEGQPAVTGGDAATPDWFVPIPGIRNLSLDSRWHAAKFSLPPLLEQLGRAPQRRVIVNGLSRHDTARLMQAAKHDRA